MCVRVCKKTYLERNGNRLETSNKVLELILIVLSDVHLVVDSCLDQRDVEHAVSVLLLHESVDILASCTSTVLDIYTYTQTNKQAYLGGVRIVTLAHQTSSIVDVLESVAWETSVASMVVKVLCAVDQLLLSEDWQVSGGESGGGLQASSGAKGPARSCNIVQS